jgi:hypothetical protein
MAVRVAKRRLLPLDLEHSVLFVAPGAVVVDRDLDPELGGLERMVQKR